MKRIFPKGTQPDEIIRAVATMVAQIDIKKSWAITVEPWKKPRSNQANRFLWGVVYPMILEHGGETLAGWRAEDLNEFYLGEYGGWEVLEGFGRKRMRPIKRSHSMNQEEFKDFLMFIESKCIDMGIGPLPEPEYVHQ